MLFKCLAIIYVKKTSKAIASLSNFFKKTWGVVMSIFKKILGKDEGVNMDEFLNSLDEEPEESYANADAFVKPMDLIVDTDADAIINEAKQGNIILVNIADARKKILLN